MSLPGGGHGGNVMRCKGSFKAIGEILDDPFPKYWNTCVLQDQEQEIVWYLKFEKRAVIRCVLDNQTIEGKRVI